ncbi:MAG: M48 family metallopeptidase, partial [Saprospiraceae bacterium]
MATTGIYYDGVTAIPHPIGITLNDINLQINFDKPVNGASMWRLNDIHLDTIGDVIHLHCGNDTMEFVKISDQAFIQSLRNTLKSTHRESWYQRLINLGFWGHIAIGLGILAFVGLLYFLVVPWAAARAVALIPDSFDDKIGQTFYSQYIASNEVDTAKTALLKQFTAQLNLERRKPLNFTVIHSETINAFALPDGNIVVFSGIIDKMKKYDELAALIGHEAAHINNRHSLKLLCRNLSNYLLISALLGDVNGIMAIIGDNVNNLQELSFSRQFEREADIEGLILLQKNRIDPQGILHLIERLD